MRGRPLWLTSLLCLACQGMLGDQPSPATAQALGEQGQQAGQQSLGEDRLQTNHLSLAAACLEKGDEAAACEHLDRYLQAHPEHGNARFYHAELLLKLGRHVAARDEFERVIAREQDEADPDLKHLVHCHTRLMELGDKLGDDYLVELERGIGLVLLARRSAALGAPTEGLLCKAVKALRRAARQRPDEARACWYLHLAWRALDQPEPARRWLAEADRRAPGSALTSAERCALLLAASERLEPVPRNRIDAVGHPR